MNSPNNQKNCPACNKLDVVEVNEVETYLYGENATEILVEVPVTRCNACNFAYTDARAEKARHAAVCKHLGILSPEEIQHIRKDVLGMSREAVHAAFGLSSASLERWENGKLFQNEAADTLLRILVNPDIAKANDRRARKPVMIRQDDNVIWGHFPNLSKNKQRADEAVAKSKEFTLRIQAS